MLTVEINKDNETVEIYCDGHGLHMLLDKLQALHSRGGHVHLMTTSWAGNELTEDVQGLGNQLIHHMVIALAPT